MNIGTETAEFKSPLRKLVRFFRKSRDAWKSKYQALKKKARKLANQVAAVEKSRNRWRREAKAMRMQVEELEKERMQQKQKQWLQVQS